MDKELFKDKNPLLRRQMLEDNCAAVERITYTSPFSEEEMGERKTELANIDLDMAALEEEKKAFFEANKSKFNKPESASAKHILVDSEELANDILNKINNNEMTFEAAASALRKAWNPCRRKCKRRFCRFP